MGKLRLVRKYEPVLLFSKDDQDREENFFPMSVEYNVGGTAADSSSRILCKCRTIKLPRAFKNKRSIASCHSSLLEVSDALFAFLGSLAKNPAANK